jgi:site-specific recombinase XerC
MRGSPVFQVNQVFETVRNIGESKHDAKAEAREAGASTKAEIAKEMGVHSYGTFDKYRDISINAFKEIREEFGVKDITNLTGEHIQHFLDAKVEAGIARSTFDTYSSAMQKLEVALNRFSEQNNLDKSYSFSSSINESRSVAHQEIQRPDVSRAFSNPESLIKEISNETHELAARVQHEAGLRISELGEIKNVREDSFDVKGKGGKERECSVSRETMKDLKDYLKNNNFKWSESQKNAYRESLKEAAERSGQQYNGNGSHGLRWNYAQERMSELQQAGHSYESAQVQVSQEMGHERADITEHYLR